MQTLRKKTSPLKYKNETSRFLGEGMSFKAKLIGILEVSEARGDRMCQEALSDLKIAIRAAGEHKQRIIINVAIDGLRLRDEKTGDSLYHHPVHKISFIAQDMTDSRAFGYIFGSPDTGHRFFGIKTDKAASQVVIAMRDLFQVVFALKKKEIELAKQNLEKNYCFNRDSSNIISESLPLDTGDVGCNSAAKNSSVLKSHGAENKTNTPVVANLVDLEIELTNLQQGISQIEQLTPSDPFNSNDPFGDSFISYTPKPILPPPPGRERSCRSADIAGNSISKAQTITTTINKESPQMLPLLQSSDELTLIKSHNESNDETAAGDWFISSVNGTATVKDALMQSSLQKDFSTTLQSETQKKEDILQQFDVFTELDPLGTGKIKPYVHKRDFFQDLKKPKKVLNDLVNDKQTYSSCPTNTNESFKSESLGFATDPFGEDPFIKSDSFAEKDPFSKDNFNVDFTILEKEQDANDLVDDMATLTFSNLNEDSCVATRHLESNVENEMKFSSEVDPEDYKKTSPDGDNAPKPPPRPTNNILTQPPPLPPKKQPGDLCMKPPPRPPHSDDSHYDVIPKEIQKDSETGPPLPAPARKAKPTQFSFEHQKKKLSVESSEDDYLTPIPFPPPKEFSFAEKKSFVHKITDNVSTNVSFQNLEPLDRESSSILRSSTNMSLADINFMLSQLTLSGLNELAFELNIPSVELSNMTLAQITNYLSSIIKSRSENDDLKQHDNSGTSKANFADFSNFNTNETHDKYAVFRELEATEFKVNEDSNMSPVEKNEIAFFSQDSTEDKYAALREITDIDQKQSESEDFKNEADLIFEESFECLSQKSDQTINENARKFSEKQLAVSTENQKRNHKHIISQSSSDDRRESPKQFERIDDVFEEDKLQTFDSISEGASGTSPENDAATEAIKRVDRSDKEWTVFDQTKPQVGEKLSLQSEEGVSPWSSDSKEFGNATPPEWKQAVDSGSEHREKHASLKDREKWWDTSAEPEEYYQSNRRSIDSFEDEYCTYSKTLPSTRKRQMTGASPGSQAGHGGHSSSSRDISPWEEEAYTLTPAQRKNVRASENWERHSRQHFEKCRDSWDEEDDYEYDEEQYGRYYWPDRHPSRQIEKVGYSRRMKEHLTNERHLWKQELERKRHCCEDWELGNTGKANRYYGGNKRSNEGIFAHKWTSNYEDPHFLRDSQDSSWEEDYHQNSPEMQSSHYINLKHRWKRPSSASEIEKNTDEIRNKQVQYYVGTTGGSDGEKERRYKANRRSRSRDTYCCEMNVHYKQDPNFTLRNYHKSRMHHPQHNTPFNGNSQEIVYAKSDDFSNKTSGSRKKVRDDAKSNNFNVPSASNVSWKFENNFIDSSESPPLPPHGVKYAFDYEQKITEVNKPPSLRRPAKINKPKNQNVRSIPGNSSKNRKFTYQSADQNVISRRTQRSPFEDDFSPPPATFSTPIPMSSQMEPSESDLKNEEKDHFSPDMSDKKSAMTKKINSNRLGNFGSDDGLKKSESVNIFVRENDPFDDDFFSENTLDSLSDYAKSPKSNR